MLCAEIVCMLSMSEEQTEACVAGAVSEGENVI